MENPWIGWIYCFFFPKSILKIIMLSAHWIAGHYNILKAQFSSGCKAQRKFSHCGVKRYFQKNKLVQVGIFSTKCFAIFQIIFLTYFEKFTQMNNILVSIKSVFYLCIEYLFFSCSSHNCFQSSLIVNRRQTKTFLLPLPRPR